MALLEAKLAQAKAQKSEKEIARSRKAQIGKSERAEKIRTYNFPQDRVTDHRIQKSWHGIKNILEGELDELIDLLQQEA